MIKIVSVVMILSVLLLYLKNSGSEFFSLALIASGIILTAFSLEYIREAFDFFNKLSDISGIDSEIYFFILKIVGIGYVIEFTSATVEDFGLKSLSNKITFIGKLIIITMSFPIINLLFNMIGEFLS